MVAVVVMWSYALLRGKIKYTFSKWRDRKAFPAMVGGASNPLYSLIIAYANDWPGYVPTRASYAEGGYGVDLCAVVFDHQLRFRRAPEDPEIAVIKIEEVRRRIYRSQCAVYVELITFEFLTESSG